MFLVTKHNTPAEKGTGKATKLRRYHLTLTSQKISKLFNFVKK